MDPGWKGTLTLELSNVANLPIALYAGMRIGQISFFRMSSPVERPYGCKELGPSTRASPSPRRPRSTRTSSAAQGPRRRLTMGINDAVHWSADLGGGTNVALVQAGTFRSDAGTLLGPVPWVLWRPWAEGELDENRRLIQALNCLLVETPAGRVLIETGIGERMDEKNTGDARLRGHADGARAPRGRLRPGVRGRGCDEPSPLRPCRRPAPGRRDEGVPTGEIVAQRAEWEIALERNCRVLASYDQPELRLVADWGAEGWTEGDRELLPGVSVVRTGGHSAGHQAVVVRGTGPGRGRWRSSATCACGPGRPTRAG